VVSVDELPVVKAYPDLRSVFQNLVSNAIKFARKDAPAHIHISATEGNKEWTFVIKDNGIGIDKKYHEKIFVIFQKLHNQSEYTGTGIGLSQSKKIVEMHKGKIWLESEPGKGSTFYFTIPKNGSR
jgi:light-regulated signal transduction histidine kinase (bacteriophytochrome)